MSDALAEWSRSRHRVVALVREASSEALGGRVPACPDWTCLDLVRHMVGLGADVLAGDEPDDHDPRWTQAQVDARASRSAEELLGEWDALAPELLTWMSGHGSRPLNDVVIHEQDLRGALGVPGVRESAGVAIVRDRLAQRLARRLDGRDDLTSVELVAPAWRWSSQPGDEPGLVLAASGFDLARALSSRRTPEQLASYATRGDVTAYLPALAILGDLPTEPLPE